MQNKSLTFSFGFKNTQGAGKRVFQTRAGSPFHLPKSYILACSLCSRGITATCLVQLPSVSPCLISWRPSVEVTSFKAHHNHKLVFYSHYRPFETGWQFSITLFTTSSTSNLNDLMSAAPPLRLHLYITPTARCCFTFQSSSAESRSSLLILECFG